MPTGNELFTITERGWTVRVQPPQDPTAAAGLLLLLHGRTGDENVMWIFSRGLRGNYWMLSPRAPLSDAGGFSWLAPSADWPALVDFAQVASTLMNELETWQKKLGITAQTMDVMGFSQGAALSYALAAFYPRKVRRLMALAGFLPREDEIPGRYNVLEKKRVFITHGSQDRTVPVEMALEAVQILQNTGAQVTFCPSQTGHKISTACIHELASFFRSSQS